MTSITCTCTKYPVFLVLKRGSSSVVNFKGQECVLFKESGPKKPAHKFIILGAKVPDISVKVLCEGEEVIGAVVQDGLDIKPSQDGLEIDKVHLSIDKCNSVNSKWESQKPCTIAVYSGSTVIGSFGPLFFVAKSEHKWEISTSQSNGNEQKPQSKQASKSETHTAEHVLPAKRAIKGESATRNTRRRSSNTKQIIIKEDDDVALNPDSASATGANVIGVTTQPILPLPDHLITNVKLDMNILTASLGSAAFVTLSSTPTTSPVSPEQRPATSTFTSQPVKTDDPFLVECDQHAIPDLPVVFGNYMKIRLVQAEIAHRNQLNILHKEIAALRIENKKIKDENFDLQTKVNTLIDDTANSMIGSYGLSAPPTSWMVSKVPVMQNLAPKLESALISAPSPTQTTFQPSVAAQSTQQAPSLFQREPLVSHATLLEKQVSLLFTADSQLSTASANQQAPLLVKTELQQTTLSSGDQPQVGILHHTSLQADGDLSPTFPQTPAKPDSVPQSTSSAFSSIKQPISSVELPEQAVSPSHAILHELPEPATTVLLQPATSPAKSDNPVTLPKDEQLLPSSTQPSQTQDSHHTDGIAASTCHTAVNSQTQMNACVSSTLHTPGKTESKALHLRRP